MTPSRCLNLNSCRTWECPHDGTRKRQQRFAGAGMDLPTARAAESLCWPLGNAGTDLQRPSALGVALAFPSPLNSWLLRGTCCRFCFLVRLLSMRQIDGVDLWWLQDHAGQHFCAVCLSSISRQYMPLTQEERKGSIMEGPGHCRLCGQAGTIMFWKTALSTQL
jgi:hypothetical protein